MDKKSIAILLVASSFASSAFASSIIDKLITKRSSATHSSIKTHKTTKQINRSYTDFSGTWIPNCGDGPGQPTVIENDVNYISLDGEESRIGRGLQGRYESNDEDARYDHYSFEWNTDGSALTVKSADVSKDNTDNSTILTDMTKFTLTMKNGQINVDGKWALYEDGTQIEQPMTVHCVFTKSNSHSR